MPDLNVVISAGTPLYGEVVSHAQLGANFLFNRVAFDEGVGSGAFDETALALGLKHLRYPGGTISETQFDLANPDNTYQPTNLVTGAAIGNSAHHELTPLSDFLDFARAADADVSIVLPTAQYRQAILQGGAALGAARAEVKAFIADLMQSPGARSVEVLEIGNEWQGMGLSAAEYGRIANAMVTWIDESLGDFSGPVPKIAVQVSQLGLRLSETRDILAELSAPARAAVDAVIIHNYRPEPWTEAGVTSRKISHVAEAERIIGKPLEIIVSEWNVGNASDRDGLLQGAGLLELFNQHARSGVDLAHVWPLFENNTTRLAADVEDPAVPAELMIGGEIFRQMNVSLPGSRVLGIDPRADLDGDGSDDVLIHGYGDPGGGEVLFVSSLKAAPLALSIDAGVVSAARSAAHVWATTTGVADGANPLSPSARPETHAWAIEDPADLTFDLDAYGILRLEFAGPAAGARVLEDHQGVQDFRLTSDAEVVVLNNHGTRDLVRGFEPGFDRIDISSLGIASFDAVDIVERQRKDGSVSWIELRDTLGEAHLAMRFASGPLIAERLKSDSFIYAAEAAPPPIDPGGPDGLGYDDFAATDAGEIFRLADDGVRDLLRDFDLEADLLDISFWGAQSFADIEVSNQVRRDGSFNWVEIRDSDGQAEIALRFSDGVPDGARLTATNFLFANTVDPGPEVPRVVDSSGLDDLRGTPGAEVFLMQDDGVRDLVRGFEVGVDMLDLRALGAGSLQDLTLTDIHRKDGSVSWIEVRDSVGESEFLLRLAAFSDQSAGKLSADDFLFS